MYLLSSESSHYTVPVNLSKLDPKTTVGDFVFNFYNMITKHTPRAYYFNVFDVSSPINNFNLLVLPKELIVSKVNGGKKLAVVLCEFDQESTESKLYQANSNCRQCGTCQVGTKEVNIGVTDTYIMCKNCKIYYPLTKQ